MTGVSIETLPDRLTTTYWMCILTHFMGYGTPFMGSASLQLGTICISRLYPRKSLSLWGGYGWGLKSISLIRYAFYDHMHHKATLYVFVWCYSHEWGLALFKAVPLLQPSGGYLFKRWPIGNCGTSQLCTVDLCFLQIAVAMVWHTFKCCQSFRQLHTCILLSRPFKDGGSKHNIYIIWFLMNPV